ncbi:MAG: NifU family protein [SAR324 cluster bacterium]|nr:NifU family protein [SAR324 cluster bacterium]MBL7035142.1 NifU family protein [SAR324 cluster bacterium]
MFKFKDLTDDNDFNTADYRLTPREFFEKRRTSKRPYVFDLRSSEAYELEHIPGSHSLPIEHFENSIYQMPFAGDILLYGGEDGEVLTAAEILYDNGFDSFSFTDSYEALFSSFDSTFLSITEAAKKLLEEKIQNSDSQIAVQLIIESTSALKANYRLELLDSQFKDSIQFEVNGIRIYTERKTASFLEGTAIEINEDGELVPHNPQLSISKLSGSLEEQIQLMLDEQVNPMLASHGGNVMLEGIKENSAYVRFGGGCQGCSMIDTTVKQGVEVMLKEAIPELAGVYDVTDHSEGVSPFFTG